jgi:chromosomal replication initiation ATPase DnaA
MSGRFESALADRAAILASVPPPPRLRDIVAAVAGAFQVLPDRVLSETRIGSVVRARHACVLLARQRTDQSFHQIGRLLGRDHSTVQHSLRAAMRLELEDEQFAAALRVARLTLEDN